MTVRRFITCLGFAMGLLLGLMPQATAQAQKSCVQWVFTDGLPSRAPATPTLCADSLPPLHNAVREQLANWQQAGYWAASLDSSAATESRLICYVHIGPYWEGIRTTLIKWPTNWGKSSIKQPSPLLTPNTYKSWQRQLLERAATKGYPFAALVPTQLIFDTTAVQITLEFRPGPAVLFDTLIYAGESEVNVKKNYLASYLRLRDFSLFGKGFQGALFDQRIADRAEEAIERLPFLTNARPPQVLFKEKSAYLQVFLKPRQANRIDGLLGFQTTPEGRNVLTGQADLQFHNLFGSGQALSVQWRRLQAASPAYFFEFIQPFLWKTPLGFHARLASLKQDSTFFNLEQTVGIRYQLPHMGVFTVSYQRQRSTLLGGEVLLPPALSGIPLGESTWRGGGAVYELDRRDRAEMPRRGYHATLGTTIGEKSFRQRQADTLGIEQAVPQWQMQWQWKQYLQTGTRSTALLQIKGAHIASRQLLISDLLRVGGINSLRGFAENQLFVATYQVTTAEYQYFWENSSNIFLLIDQAMLRFPNNPTLNWAYGSGLGMTVSLPNGILKIVYAFGFGNHELPNSNNIHIGFSGKL